MTTNDQAEEPPSHDTDRNGVTLFSWLLPRFHYWAVHTVLMHGKGGLGGASVCYDYGIKPFRVLRNSAGKKSVFNYRVFNRDLGRDFYRDQNK